MAFTDLPREPEPEEETSDEFEEEEYADDIPNEVDVAEAAHAGDGPAESLRELTLYLATNLVDDPAAVDVSVERRGGTVDLRLTVPEEELGRIIGRQGRIARALRTSLMVAASRHHLRVSLDIEPS